MEMGKICFFLLLKVTCAHYNKKNSGNSKIYLKGSLKKKRKKYHHPEIASINMLVNFFPECCFFFNKNRIMVFCMKIFFTWQYMSAR